MYLWWRYSNGKLGHLVVSSAACVVRVIFGDSGLFLYLCYVFRALINSPVCWFCTSALGLVLIQICDSELLSCPKMTMHTNMLMYYDSTRQDCTQIITPMVYVTHLLRTVVSQEFISDQTSIMISLTHRKCRDVSMYNFTTTGKQRKGSGYEALRITANQRCSSHRRLMQ